MEPTDDDTISVEYLSEDECWDLAAGAPIGRIGIIHDSAPEIYPVNHRVDAHTIVFRTDPGTKLAGLARTPRVCFEIDGVDPTTRTGWSVLIKGHADQLHNLDERARVQANDLPYWATGPKRHWIVIRPDEVTGRRIQRNDIPDPEIEAAERRARLRSLGRR
jgi:hypothetical protein